ncbi:MarR family winged helix-turn-helix transcriptional regulator [Lentzea sp. NEAU-D7]|uniref:MarR family winged helix-turn-helix transcriptional regulator n=1 Tax=Lentzea sp. NEAU-D7 TaxID=2994667 RepID=UPI00224AF47F|nr:MarR family transcriptional regulator [Lentzea sp. NEAU-D7]MCX2948867.1 MarR family transcriptional regulator [Lentzea sp. NEAU-D7]
MTRSKVDTTSVDALADAVLTASRLLVAVSARSIAAAGDTITLPQFRVLVVLQSRGPMKLTTLAEFLGVNPSTATRTVDRLLALEMVARQPNPASRREVVIELTESGKKLVRDVTRRRRAGIRKIVERMPEDHRQGLIDALTAFATAGGEPAVNGSDLGWI